MGANIIINMSRIGRKGTGLSVFSKNVVKCLESRFGELLLITPKSLDIRSHVPVQYVPDWVSMTPAVSRIRPILWYLYTSLFFPKRDRILSTTHHVIRRVKRQVITIHDLRPYFYPDSLMQLIYFKYLLPNVIHKVDGILTVSEATKRLIISCYKVDAEKIYVVPNCVDVSKFYPKNNLQQPSATYILMVGATWRHKNAHELIENKELWAHKYRLKILAGIGRYRKELEDLISKKNLLRKVDFIDYLNETELIKLYQNASALIYPSLMEGFGIPPIEAMACGVPVIVSDIEIFREIYGDAPIYVELGKKDSWADAFSALNNNEFIQRNIQFGLITAKKYSENRMCKALVNALSSIWPDLSKE